MASRPTSRAQRQVIARAATGTTGAKSESAWTCSKEMLQTFRQPCREIWDQNDTSDRNGPEVSKLDRIFIIFGVAPAVFPELVRTGCVSDDNVM